MPFGFVAPVTLHGNASRLGTRQLARSPPFRLAAKSVVRAVVKVGPNQQLEAFEALGDISYVPPDGSSFRNRAIQLAQEGILPELVVNILLGWFDSYRKAAEDNQFVTEDPTVLTERHFQTLLELARRAVQDPITFQPYHAQMRRPFDYYKFGFDFASVLLNVERSTVIGKNHLAEAVEYASQGHNVIFLSNHQSEGDPYAIDALLSFVAKCDRQFCEAMVFMAGDRVRNDPVVSPFSAGRNLLTVYSKKHINDIPEEKSAKLLHNRRTITASANLFKEGGKSVWFAPSGGRDRLSKETGRVELSQFDEGAVEMMRYTALKAGTPCHFYPMSLVTYDMLPPPSSVGGAEIGEERIVNHIPMHMYVGEELDWTISPDITGKEAKRKARCDIVFQKVKRGYEVIGGYEQ